VGLTVVIPVWGRYVRYLTECVDSIWHQRKETGLRLLVIDNASDEPLPTLPDGVEVDRLPARRTLGAARNRGLELTETELISFCDADDVFPEGYFGFARSRFAARPELIGVGVRAVALLADGSERPFPWPSDAALAASRRRRRLAIRNMLREHCVPMSGSTFRTAALERAGGYSDLEFNDDRNLGVLLPFLGDVEVHRAPGRRYRLHPDSVTRTPRDEESIRASFAEARRRLRRHPDVPRWAKALLPLVRIHHARQTNAVVGRVYERHAQAVLAERAGA
jgi:glycosyltransferase involved in cell wall biosynthesis